MTDEDLRPWEQPGAVRRDCEPHRASWLWALGTAALGCGIASLVLPLLAPAGLAFGLLAAQGSKADVSQIDAGLMDPAGREDTRRAGIRAFAGTVLSLLFGGVWTLLVAPHMARWLLGD
jgi:hypothetical protein